MNICLVYLGNRLPKYARENFSYLQRTFPTEKIWLLSDSLENLKFASNLGIRVWKSSKTLDGWKALKNSELDHEFRNGFYSHALGRFAALNDFMQLRPKESLLHIESDVWIAPNFPFSEIRKINQEVAFPLERQDRAIPSTLYLKNSRSMSKLFQFMTDRLRNGFPAIDMFLLAEYFNVFPERVHILPSFLSDPSVFNLNLDYKTQKQLLKNSDKYAGVFDSSTWGQYFFGIDPRNTHGIKVLYRVQENHVFNPSIPEVTILPNGCVQVTSKMQRKFLYSMHIHSKDKRIFLQSSHNFIQNALMNSRRQKVLYRLTVFSIREFFRASSYTYLIKLFLKSKKKFFSKF